MSHAHKTRAHRFVKENKTCRLCMSKKGAKYTCYLIYTTRLSHIPYKLIEISSDILSNLNAFFYKFSTFFKNI